MREILVVRFSSLGDLCVLGASLARWHGMPGASERRVTLVTKAAFAPLLRRFRGIDDVFELEGSGLGDLARLAGRLQERRWDIVLDAHGTLRSHLLLARAGLRPDGRLAKDTAARMVLLRWRSSPRALDRTMSDRFDELFAAAGAGPIASAANDAGPALALERKAAVGLRLGLAPGAQWPSKQWPEENFARLLELFRGRSAARVSIFLGPREQDWYAGSRLESVAAAAGAVDVVRDRPLTEVAAGLADCSLLVTNDSGLLHVAEAAGTPVIALFGPTVRQFGYFPRLRASRALEVALDCRPCSRNGKRACHRGDLACLRGIDPQTVLDAVMESAEWPAAEVPR